MKIKHTLRNALEAFVKHKRRAQYSAGRTGRRLGRSLTSRSLLATVLALACTVVTGYAVSETQFVTVRDDREVLTFRTLSRDINDIMRHAGVELDPHDYVTLSQNGPIVEIEVNSLLRVKVSVDGGSQVYHVTGGSVSELLKQKGITLSPYDFISCSLQDMVRDGMEITINRVNYEYVTKETATPYTVKRIEATDIEKGSYVEMQKGENGLSRTILRNTYIDGKLTDSEVVRSETVKPVVDAVIKYGVGGVLSTSRGDTLRYTKRLEVVATAYTYGEGGNRTATGKPVQVGYIAVDPKVIPYGTRLYITWPNGKTQYGFAVAEDTGGAIKGNKIDLFYETSAECRAFGRRELVVYILE